MSLRGVFHADRVSGMRVSHSWKDFFISDDAGSGRRLAGFAGMVDRGVARMLQAGIFYYSKVFNPKTCPEFSTVVRRGTGDVRGVWGALSVGVGFARIGVKVD